MTLDEYKGLNPSFAEACRRADAKRAAEYKAGNGREPKQSQPDRSAAVSTIEALMLALRERGLAALEESKVQRRLGELNRDQLLHVAERLQKRWAWRADKLEILICNWSALQ